MKALRKLATGPGNVGVAEIPDPVPESGAVRIRVERAGICGTDLHILHGRFPRVRPPVTLGHEVSGVVDSVGSGVSGWCPGDRVTVESQAYACGGCPPCRSGRPNLCPERLALGYGVDGGFAEFLCVRASALHRLPEGVGFGEGALCEPLAVAVHAVTERGHVDSGARVLVTGPGPVGLLVLQVARNAGARVIVTGTEKDRDRLSLAVRLGAEEVLTAGNGDPLGRIAEITDGEGVDAAFECAGAGAALNMCLAAVRPRGRILQVGLFGRPVEADLDRAVMKEIRFEGAFVHTHETWRRALDLLGTGRVDLESMVSGELPLSEWENAFGLSESGSGIKYLLVPEPDA